MYRIARTPWLRASCARDIFVIFVLTGTAAARPPEIPEGIPQAAREMSERVRQTHPDALLMRVEVRHDDSGPTEAGPFLYFFSPSEHVVLRLPGDWTSHADELIADQFGGRGSFIPVPDFNVDLPQALSIAQKAGMPGQTWKAELSVKTPRGRLPVLLWRIQPKQSGSSIPYYVDALTGIQLTNRQVSEPGASPDPTLQSSERALRQALRQSPPPGNPTLWMEFVVKPILEAKDVMECNARGGGWTITRMCMP